MDRLLVACGVLSAAGLVLLGVLAVAVEPRPIPIHRMARYEGQRVCVEATLAHLRPTVGDARRFVLVEDNASLAGRTRFAWAAVPGDRVAACGTLAREAGTLLLDVARAGDARVLHPWDEEVVALALLAERPWDHVDRHVAVVGRPAFEGRVAYLEDPTSHARVRLASADGLEAGALERVEGTFAYDPDESRFALHVEAHRGVTA